MRRTNSIVDRRNPARTRRPVGKTRVGKPRRVGEILRQHLAELQARPHTHTAPSARTPR
jgi:hypothetical protein